MTKKAALLALGMSLAGAAMAQSPAVRGQVKKDGTHVAPQMATRPNASKLDPASAKGTADPYTGNAGTKDPYEVPLLKSARPLM